MIGYSGECRFVIPLFKVRSFSSGEEYTLPVLAIEKALEIEEPAGYHILDRGYGIDYVLRQIIEKGWRNFKFILRQSKRAFISFSLGADRNNFCDGHVVIQR